MSNGKVSFKTPKKFVCEYLPTNSPPKDLILAESDRMNNSPRRKLKHHVEALNHKFMENESLWKFRRSYPFTEYVGILHQVEHRDSYVTVFLSFAHHGESKHIFTFFHQEAEITAQKLQKLVGKNVGILQTDDPSNPIRIRVIGQRNSSTPRTRQTWQPSTISRSSPQASKNRKLTYGGA